MLCDVGELVPAFGVLLGICVLIFLVSLVQIIVVTITDLHVEIQDDRFRDLDELLKGQRAVSRVVVAVTLSRAFCFLLGLSVDFVSANRAAELRIVAVVFVDPAAEMILDLALPFALLLLF